MDLIQCTSFIKWSILASWMKSLWVSSGMKPTFITLVYQRHSICRLAGCWKSRSHMCLTLHLHHSRTILRTAAPRSGDLCSKKSEKHLRVEHAVPRVLWILWFPPASQNHVVSVKSRLNICTYDWVVTSLYGLSLTPTQQRIRRIENIWME